MSKRTDKEFILDMYIACNRIINYVADLKYENFIN